MRKLARWSVFLWGVLALGAGCGQSTGSTGSNTNWLTRCNEDGDCGARGTCWCGACTSSCGPADACHDGSCHPSDELGCGTPSGANICVAECAGPVDCERVGAGVECINGACLPAGSAGRGGGGGTDPSGGAASAGNGGQRTTGQTSGGGGVGGSGVSEGGAASGDDTAGGAPVRGPLVPDGAKLALSFHHSCYLWADGGESHLECWGDNQYGESTAFLPGIVSSSVDTPRRVVNVVDPVAVAVSDGHSCALTAAGDVYCWGLNDAGQIGGASAPESTCPNMSDGSQFYPCQPEPQRVESVKNAVRIAVSNRRSCALLRDGSVRCWGDIDPLSAWLASVAEARSIAMGDEGACVTNADGAPVCSFELSAGDTLPALDAITLNGGGVSYLFACTLGSDRRVRCVGDNTRGELGIGFGSTEQGLPIDMRDATAIALGGEHACALGTDATVRCWGDNTDGQLGTPPLTSPVCGGAYCEALPREVTGLPPIVAIAARGERTCAVAEDRTLWCLRQQVFWEGALMQRIGGPWEPNPLECQDRMAALDTARLEAIQNSSRDCERDDQCFPVSVDLSCAHSCALQSVANGAELEGAIAALEAEYCGGASMCSAPEVSCPASTARPVCVMNTCTQTDPDHSGCEDACGCKAVVGATGLFPSRDECSGHNLRVDGAVMCGECTGASEAFAIGNYGDTRFSGEAKITFRYLDPSAGTRPPRLPEGLTLALDLEPGAVSAPIHVPSPGYGLAAMKVKAAGDCKPEDDEGVLLFPSSERTCE